MKRFFYVAFFIITLILSGCGSVENDTASSEQDNTFIISRSNIDPTVPISIKQVISLVFSSPLDGGTIDGNVYLERIVSIQEGGEFSEVTERIGANFEIGSPSTNITMTPYQYLKPASHYKIVVTTGVKDTQGRSLSRNYIYAFSTDVEELDSSELDIRGVKPEDGDDNILVDSDIVIDFNKNLEGIPPVINIGEYFSFEAQDSGSSIAEKLLISGKIEVFNSMLKFIPDEPWPYDSEITVSYDHNISDLYGNEFTQTNPISWSFTTRTEEETHAASAGFKSIKTLNTAKTSYVVRTLFDGSNGAGESKSLIAVARDGGIDIYSVNYSSIQQAPTILPESTIPVASKINAMETSPISSSSNILMIFISTATDGVFVYKLSIDGELIETNHFNSGKSMYGIDMRKNTDGLLERLYAVGPHFGLQLYEVDPNSAEITLGSYQDTNITGKAIDVLQAEGYDQVLGASVYKTYVADYSGRVVVLDDNAQNVLATTDMHMSVKRLDYQQDYNGIMGVYVVGTSGKMKGIGFDGGMNTNVKSSLAAPSYDVKSYANSNTMFSKMYYASGYDGVICANGDFVDNVIKTGGKTISIDIISQNSNSNNLYLVTLNEDGKLQIFNASQDIFGPFISNIVPNEGDSMPQDANLSLSLWDYYLDETTITHDSFSIYDKNTSSFVEFTFGRSSISHYNLDPVETLRDGDEYIFTIKPVIMDMVGNQFNNGEDRNISFNVGGAA